MHSCLFSTRVSNELGAGNPRAAQVAVWAAILLAIGELIIATATLLGCRNILGYAFSNEKDIVNYLKELNPLLCLLLVMDSIQAVLSGIYDQGLLIVMKQNSYNSMLIIFPLLLQELQEELDGNI